MNSETIICPCCMGPGCGTCQDRGVVTIEVFERITGIMVKRGKK